MLKENERLYNNILGLFDVILSLFAFVLAYYIRVFTIAKSLMYPEQYLTLGILIIPVWFILVKIINLQSEQRIKAYSVVIIEYGIIIIIGISILFIFIFLFKLDNISRIAILIFGITDFIFLLTAKILFYKIIKRKTVKGKSIKNIILITDETSVEFIEKIIHGKQWGYKIFFIISDSLTIKEKYFENYKIHNNAVNIDKILEENAIDEVIYCKNEIDTHEVRNLIYSCKEIGVTLQMQSELINLIASRSHVNYFGETPVMSFSTTPTDYFALTVKTFLDYFISIFALLFFLPVLFITAVIIKIESKGPVFFKQKRVGLRGRMFTMFKIT